MMLRLFFPVMAGLLAGCISSKPSHDLGFGKPNSLRAFEGCYQNLGDRGTGTARRYLTALIWPDAAFEHSTIDAVRVNAIDDSSVEVIALSERQPVQRAIFTEGKDFSFDSGRIHLAGKVQGSAAQERGNIFIGVGHETRTLGLDPRGDGRVEETGTFAGTAFLVIPVAGHVREATRFRKSPQLCGD
jgi:hypothetical protein